MARTLVLGTKGRAGRIATAGACALAGIVVVVQALVQGKLFLLVVAVVLAGLAAWAGSLALETVRLVIDDAAQTLSIARRRWPRASIERTVPISSIQSVEVTELRIPGDLDVDVI